MSSTMSEEVEIRQYIGNLAKDLVAKVESDEYSLDALATIFKVHTRVVLLAIERYIEGSFGKSYEGDEPF